MWTDVGVTYGGMRPAAPSRTRGRRTQSFFGSGAGGWRQYARTWRARFRGVDQPEAYRRRGVQLTLTPGTNWYQLTEEMLHQVVAAG